MKKMCFVSVAAIVVLITGCASTTTIGVRDELTSAERSSITKLVIFTAVGNTPAIEPLVEVAEGLLGTTVRIVGGGGEIMSMSTYRRRMEEAEAATENCVAETYGESRFVASVRSTGRYVDRTSATDPFRSMLAMMLQNNNAPFDIVFAPEVDYSYFWPLSDEEQLAIIDSYEADARLVLSATLFAGYFPSGGMRSLAAAQPVVWARIVSYPNEEVIYYSGQEKARIIPIQRGDFCNYAIETLEQAADEWGRRWFDEIVGGR